MKIAFICSSLEPGRDGVGDYTRRLAGELIRQGHSVVAVGLNEPNLAETLPEQQEIEGATIAVLRLASGSSWSRRVTETRDWLRTFNPDWLSLQFVPFGFHDKGLFFGLGKSLAAIKTKASWHIMFHELWLGLGENAPFKHRVWGLLQRLIVWDFMGRLHPRIVHTQAESYRIALLRENLVANILPLFSNIPRCPGDGWTGLLEPLVTAAAGKSQDRSQLYLAGVLGGVHPEWSAETTVNILLPLVQRGHKRLVLVFLGKHNLTPEAVNQLKAALHSRAEVVFTGEKSAADISILLQALDLGLATTPRQIIQKSGSAAAMLEHGLQILVTRNDWQLRGLDAPLDDKSPRFLSPEQFAVLKNLPVRDQQPPGDCGLTRVAHQLVAAMKSPVSAYRAKPS